MEHRDCDERTESECLHTGKLHLITQRSIVSHQWATRVTTIVVDCESHHNNLWLLMGAKTIPEAFGEILRECRTKAGISQEQLALKSDLDRTYISLPEKGIEVP